MSNITVIGSIAYDSISTPEGSRDRVLGGSANYFSVAASLFSKVNVVGVIGEDYASEDLELLSGRGVDISGIKKVSGKTFHWAGEYKGDMNEAITLETHLNVFESFDPQLTDAQKKSDYVFLANIDPELQLNVLEQIDNPKFVAADTMNFWIQSKIGPLRQVLEKIDVLLINEGEATMLTETSNAIAAAEILATSGPKAVVIKRGEYGFVLYTEGEYFILPAFPIRKVVDPTGAGDTFAGGFFGYLAKFGLDTSMNSLKHACVHGSLMASFTVQDFGLGSLRGVDESTLEKRHLEYSKVVSYPM